MKIKRFKLNALSAETLQQKEMNAIVGGNNCGCSCYYANNAGSASEDNMIANYSYGYESNNQCNFIAMTEYSSEVVCRPKAS